jgi:Xaa-Pro aminopeptidase
LADVLIWADTLRSPELRHEVPVAIPDPFLYVEHDGERHAVVTAFEVERIEEVDGIKCHPFEELGWDEMIAKGMKREEMDLEVCARACREFGIKSAVAPMTFPLAIADRLRADGVELKADHDFFVSRRRVKSTAELEGIGRAQRGAEAAMAAARELIARAEPRNGAAVLDGEPLTCERIKFAIQQVFTEHDVFADEFIVSHGAQSAVGHEMGSGPIASGEPIVIDLWPRDRRSACYADMTRTFVVGEPSDELAEYQRLVHDALERSVEAVKPGVPGRDVYVLVCELFEEHGYPTGLSKAEGEVLEDGFFHGLGHGVGLEVHEQPWLGRYPGELVEGDVITLEPGLYRHGYGGCRLEDLVRVSADGAERLTDFPYDLTP